MGNGCGKSDNVANTVQSLTVFNGEIKTVEVELEEIIEVTHNTRLFRFKLPQGHTLGLPVGRHIQIQATVTDEIIKRSYTPTTLDSTVGYFDLIIKVYFPNETFPHGGVMSQYLNGLSVGNMVKVIGPRGKIVYNGNGEFNLKSEKIFKTKEILMIAGGTGITPMLQIIRQIESDPTDKTKVSLIFTNKTEDDILCKKELDNFENDQRFSIHYTLTKPGDLTRENWDGKIGRVTEKMISECFPPATKDSIVLLCGPNQMIKSACLPNLLNLNYNSERIFTF